MSLLAVIALGPISTWLASTYLWILGAFGGTIGGILAWPFAALFHLFSPWGL
jgi:hypothetical protein